MGLKSDLPVCAPAKCFGRKLFFSGIFGLITVCVSHGQSINSTNKLPSNIEISQKIAGKWTNASPSNVNASILNIDSNGNYICYLISRKHTRTNILEGRFQITDGVLIDNLTKSSITNEPTPLVFTNEFIKLDDNELVYKTKMGNRVTFKKIKN